MAEGTYNPIGAFSRIMSSGTGAADMVFGLHDRAQAIRSKNLAAQAAIMRMAQEEQEFPLQQKLLNEQVAAQSLNRLIAGMQAAHTARESARRLRWSARAMRTADAALSDEEAIMDGNSVDLPFVPGAGTGVIPAIPGIRPGLPSPPGSGVELHEEGTGAGIDSWYGGGVFPGLGGGQEGILGPGETLQPVTPSTRHPSDLTGDEVAPYHENNLDRPPPFSPDDAQAGQFDDLSTRAMQLGGLSAEDINTGRIAPMSAADFTPVTSRGSSSPKVTTYWHGETGKRADYDNAFGKDINGGLVDQDSLALSPDQESLVRAHGVKPGDWLDVQLSDGTTVPRRWDDRTSDTLSGRWDFHGGSGPDPRDGKRVIGFKPRGSSDFTPVGTNRGSATTPVSDLRRAARTAPIARELPTVTPDELPQLPKGQEWTSSLHEDRLLREKLRPGPPGLRRARKLELAIAELGGKEELARLGPEVSGRFAAAMHSAVHDSLNSRWLEEQAKLDQRDANRLEAESLFQGYGMTPDKFPEDFAAMARGKKFDKDSLATRVKFLNEQEQSGSTMLQSLARDPNSGSLANAGLVLGANMSKEKAGQFQQTVAKFLAGGNTGHARESIKRAALAEAPPEAQKQVAAANQMKSIADQAAAVLGRFYLENDTVLGPVAGRIYDAIPLLAPKKVIQLENAINGLKSQYTKAMSGASFSEAESARYDKQFPTITKTRSQNEAGMTGLGEAVTGTADAALRNVLGGLAPAIIGRPGESSATATASPNAPPTAVRFRDDTEYKKAASSGALRNLPPGTIVWVGDKAFPVVARESAPAK